MQNARVHSVPFGAVYATLRQAKPSSPDQDSTHDSDPLPNRMAEYPKSQSAAGELCTGHRWAD
jgi:hypothetical protein